RDATDWFGANRTARFNPAAMNHKMPADEITLAEALKPVGYTTFFAGKWHLGESPDLWPEHQGYDINVGGTDKGYPHSGGGRYFAPYNNPRLKEGPTGQYLPYRLADETINFINENKNQPFLAVLSFYHVHTPLQTTNQLKGKYETKKKQLNLTNQQEFTDIEQHWPVNRPRRNRILQSHTTYAGMVEATDTAVGGVLETLEELDLLDNTVVIFTSDNGGLSTSEGSPTSNLPLRGGKGWIYEGGIREPFIVHAPGITKPGSTNHTPVSGIDILPTVLELAHAPKPTDKPIDGVSLVPTLSGDELERDALFWHYPHYANQGGPPAGAIRMGDWKLVELLETGDVALYNLKDDIGEQNDLAAQHPDRVKQMRTRLHNWYKQVDAKFLRPKNGQTPWQPE
ncbi:MAG: sulfatase, partial [Desulfobacterales bacterium]|nr:sulfatase [Desulfobacterales bacterium]